MKTAIWILYISEPTGDGGFSLHASEAEAVTELVNFIAAQGDDDDDQPAPPQTGEEPTRADIAEMLAWCDEQKGAYEYLIDSAVLPEAIERRLQQEAR